MSCITDTYQTAPNVWAIGITASHLSSHGFKSWPTAMFSATHKTLQLNITQTPGNYPKENTLHKEHGESLKSRSDRILIGFAHFDWHAQCVCVYAETAARHGTARHGTCAARRTPAAVPCNLLWCKNEHLTFAPHISTCFANLAGDKHNKLTPPPPDPRSWAAVSIGAPFRETWGNASFVGPSREVWAFSLLTFWRWDYYFFNFSTHCK